jgi:hypothetical protein
MARRTTRRIPAGVVLVAVLAVMLATVLAACGSNDKWVGTWVDVKQPSQGFVVKANGDGTYHVADPDGKNGFTATVAADGSLQGKLDLTSMGAPGKSADMTLTRTSNGHLTFVLAAGGQKVTYELKKK